MQTRMDQQMEVRRPVIAIVTAELSASCVNVIGRQTVLGTPNLTIIEMHFGENQISKYMSGKLLDIKISPINVSRETRHGSAERIENARILTWSIDECNDYGLKTPFTIGGTPVPDLIYVIAGTYVKEIKTEEPECTTPDHNKLSIQMTEAIGNLVNIENVKRTAKSLTKKIKQLFATSGYKS